LDGYASPKEHLEKAKLLGLKGFAILDHGACFGFPYYDKIKSEYSGIKMIYGTEIYEAFDMHERDKDSKYFHLVILIRNEQGRKDLNKLITKSNMDGFYYKPRLDLNAFKEYDCNNFVVLSACLASKLARCDDYEQCLRYVEEYKAIFKHFYLEMQSHKHDDQAKYNQKILQLSQDTDTPFVITTDSHFANAEDSKWQNYLVSIGRNQKGDNAKDNLELSEIYDGCYMQSEEEIYEIMSHQIGEENVKSGLENTNIINDLIDIVNMPFQEPQLPEFQVPCGFDTTVDYFRHLVECGWLERGFDKLPHERESEYRTRLEYEFDIICKMGFVGYFLIVYDFCVYADSIKMARAPGRGSAAGSLICFLLKITNLDSIKYGLIFERFLNPERISMPDVDCDYGDRAQIVQYIENKYGRNKVCQIANFVYITPLMAIQDVGRLLGLPYALTQKISEYFKVDSFEKAFELHPSLKQKYAEHMELFEIAERISGRVRGISQHAGGVCVAQTELSDYMPCKVGKDGEQVIQVDMRIVEQIGMVKFDVLGVETLNIVQQAVEDSGLTLWDVDINNEVFENDEKSYKLLGEAKTNAVFQLESSGMKNLLLRIKPKNINELSTVLALYRPDTIPMLEQYITNKNDCSKITYIHEDMKEILKPTYGIIAFQEQVMDIVRKFGGRTYGGADLFRKAIGKKDKALVKQEVEKLQSDIINNGYNEITSIEICRLLKDMGGYSFNLSHATAYAVESLQTAYMKAHYPLQFMKTLLNSKKDNNGKLNKYMVDAKEFGVEIIPPHINKSTDKFEIVDDKILFGLSAINGLGETVTQLILSERRTNGIYKNIEDLLSRVKLNTSQVVSLIKSGAIPTKDKEKYLLKYGDLLIDRKSYKQRKTISMSLSELKLNFGIETKDKTERLRLYNFVMEKHYIKQQEEKCRKQLKDFTEKYLADKEFWEFQSLSVFINNNPFESVYEYVMPFNDVEDGGSAVVVGVISNVLKKNDRNGKKYAYIQLYSSFGIIEIICWHQQYSKYLDLIVKGSKVAVKCKKKDNKAFVSDIKTFQQWLHDTDNFRKEV
ncbi:MAG: DNA polymerase III subunit alpha, partial [Oscillospiraceae bacterium]|nr:DNA polymerase III subunit alpha [Oscillospiraceae bacterium]